MMVALYSGMTCNAPAGWMHSELHILTDTDTLRDAATCDLAG